MVTAFSTSVTEFIRCCEELLSDVPGTEPLSIDDVEAVKMYLALLDERFNR